MITEQIKLDLNKYIRDNYIPEVSCLYNEDSFTEVVNHMDIKACRMPKKEIDGLSKRKPLGRSRKPSLLSEAISLDGACEEKFAITAPTFIELFYKFVDDKKLDYVEVYKKSDVDRKLFSKISSKKDYTPSKDTAIKLSFGLELSYNEAMDLIGSAGYTLAMNNLRDVIISYCFRERIYNILEVNELLYDREEKTL